MKIDVKDIEKYLELKAEKAEILDRIGVAERNKSYSGLYQIHIHMCCTGGPDSDILQTKDKATIIAIIDGAIEEKRKRLKVIEQQMHIMEGLPY